MRSFKRRSLARAIIRATVAEQAARGRRSLMDFIRLAWPIVEPGTPFANGPHLHAIVEHLEAVTRGQIRNLLINIPPRHMKSLAACVFWPVWEWLETPSRKWMFASYSLSLSVRDSLKCRRLIESYWFQRRFGDRFQLRGDQNAKERFENDHAGHRIATSTGGAATGEGGDRIVVDDPHNVTDIESAAAREAALIWWDRTMSTRLNDPKTGAKVIIMQRIHERDLAGHVLKQGGYEHLCLPAEFEPSRCCTTSIGWTDWRKAEGELLWPRRIGEKEIASFKKQLGPEGYAGQFQQRPAPAGGGRFQSEWFRYFRFVGHCGTGFQPVSDDVMREDAWELLEGPGHGQDAHATEGHGLEARATEAHATGATEIIPQKDCRRFAVMDPAGTEASEGTRPCYTVIQVWDITPRFDMLLVYQYRRQVQAPDAAEAAVRIARNFHCDFIGIEKDGLGLGIVQTVKRRGITVKPIKAKGSKEARSQIAQIRMANGQIYFPQGAAFLFDLESELLQFPRSEYCDQVDALSHAATLVQRMGEPGEDVEAEPSDIPEEEHEPGWTDG